MSKPNHKRPAPWPDDDGPPPFYYFREDCECNVCCEQRSQAQMSQDLAIVRVGERLSRAIRRGDRRNFRILSKGAVEALRLWPALIQTERH